MRPIGDLSFGAIGPPIAVRPTPIVLLEPLLVLTPEIDFEHDSLDISAAIPEVPFDLSIGTKEVGIMLQFALASHAGVERLTVVTVAVSRVVISLASVGLEHAQAAFGQYVGMLVGANLDGLDQPFVTQMIERALGVVRIHQVPFGDDTKGPDGREHQAVVAIQFVEVVALVVNEFSFGIARQFQALHEWLSRVMVPVISIASEVALTVVERALEDREGEWVLGRGVKARARGRRAGR